MSSLDPSIAQKLKEAAGPQGWSEDPVEIAPHLSEWRGRWTGDAPILLMPAETEQVARILTVCNETGIAIVPQGGNTGLVGGQIPTRGEVLISLERMNRIRSVSVEDNMLIAEAGVVLANAQKAADQAGRLFPLSLAAEGSCTIGGNVSTNAGGVNVLRYGMTRDLVLGLEVVLANGNVLDLMRGLRKDNTGYDLKQLFIGAEGTLGIVTAATLKLFPQPREVITAMVAVPDLTAAVKLLRHLQADAGDNVITFELIADVALDLVLQLVPGHAPPFARTPPFSVLLEVASFWRGFSAADAVEDSLARASDAGLCNDAIVARDDAQAAAL